MKIAIATDDRLHITKRTGRAAEFAIYEIENGKIIQAEYLENNHTHHDHHEEEHHTHGSHEHGHSHTEIVDQMKGVDMFLVNHLGPHFKVEVEKAGIPYKIIKGDLIEDILKEYFSDLG